MMRTEYVGQIVSPDRRSATSIIMRMVEWITALSAILALCLMVYLMREWQRDQIERNQLLDELIVTIQRSRITADSSVIEARKLASITHRAGQLVIALEYRLKEIGGDPSTAIPAARRQEGK